MNEILKFWCLIGVSALACGLAKIWFNGLSDEKYQKLPKIVKSLFKKGDGK